VGGVAGMIMTVPAGALVDATSRKRAYVIIPGIFTILGSALVLLSQRIPPRGGCALGPSRR
jgi:MFS family permease